jgi:hypothetical protein
MPQFDLHSLARLGAAARIKELQAQIAGLRKSFRLTGRETPIASTTFFTASTGKADEGSGPIRIVRTRKRRKMSAAARAKISATQKARWAKQKAMK